MAYTSMSYHESNAKNKTFKFLLPYRSIKKHSSAFTYFSAPSVFTGRSDLYLIIIFL